MPRPTETTDPALVTEFVCDHCGGGFRVYTSQIPKKPRTFVFCSRECKAAHQVRGGFTTEDVDRFWSKVLRRGADDCWEWQAATHKSGYGKVWWPGHKYAIQAHRVAFFLAHGYFPKAMVRHTCDNRPCCNPAHLVEGTQLDNMRDAAKRDRSAYGSRNGQAKLTEDDVREIRRVFVVGHPEYGAAALSRKYGVTPEAIARAARGITWTRIPATQP